MYGIVSILCCAVKLSMPPSKGGPQRQAPPPTGMALRAAGPLPQLGPSETRYSHKHTHSRHMHSRPKGPSAEQSAPHLPAKAVMRSRHFFAAEWRWVSCLLRLLDKHRRKLGVKTSGMCSDLRRQALALGR